MRQKFVYRKNVNCEKIMPKEDKMLIKILQQEKRYGMKRLLAEFPTNTVHLQL